MRLIIPSCSKRADEALKCPSCDGFSIKNGKSKSGKQRYLCRSCNKYFLSYYSNQACNIGTNYEIIRFTKEGLGIRSIARVLEISATTLLKRLVLIAKNLRQPPIIIGKTYVVIKKTIMRYRFKNIVFFIACFLCLNIKLVNASFECNMKSKLEGVTLRCDSVSRYLLLELIEEKNDLFFIRVNQGEMYKLKSKDEYFLRLRRANLSHQIQIASEFSEQELLQITKESKLFIENFCTRNCIKTKEIKVSYLKEEISNLKEYSLKYFDEYIAIMYELIVIKKKESKIFFTPIGPNESRILVGEDIENSRSLVDEIITMYRKELIG